jgi:hypothetical protein
MSDDGSLSDIIIHRQVRRFYRDRTRDRVPLKWAMTQASLGISTALLILSERGSGTARLEEAIAAYRDALMERTRDHVPLDLGHKFRQSRRRYDPAWPRETACQQIEAALETLRSGGHASGAAYYESVCREARRVRDGL